MSDIKISSLSDGGQIQSSDQFVIARSGSNYKIGGSKIIAISVSNVVTKNFSDSPYNSSPGDIIIYDVSGGNSVVNLPSANGIPGEKITIKRMNDSGNTLTIEGSGSETIDDQLSETIEEKYQSITLVSDGVNWIII